MSFDEHFLLDGRKFDHGPAILRVTESGEEFSGDAKVRMVHVRLFGRFGEAEGEAAKLVCGHEVISPTFGG
jgi:hypothetical protein